MRQLWEHENPPESLTLEEAEDVLRQIALMRGEIMDTTADAVVNPVNCVGVSGAGLARAVKERWPAAAVPYEAACRHRVLDPGGVLVTASGVAVPRLVVHFATKDHWRDPARLEWVARGLAGLRDVLATSGSDIRSVAVPRLGCGLGGLDWIDVCPLVVRHLGALPQRIFVYAPERNNRGPL